MGFAIINFIPRNPQDGGVVNILYDAAPTVAEETEERFETVALEASRTSTTSALFAASSSIDECSLEASYWR